MKKIIILLFPLLSFGQNFIGLHADNYKGVHGVLFNPAYIVDSPFKTDISILGTSIVGDNDIYNLTYDTDFDDVSFSDFSDDSNLYLNTDVFGLAFMMNINKNHSIALYTRIRSVFNSNDINGEIFDSFFDEFSDNDTYDITEDGFHILGHSWGEIGFSYATILYNKGEHFLKGGFTAKYLRGLGSISIESDNLRVAYDASAGKIDTQGKVSYFSTYDLSSDDIKVVNTSGFGGDLGLIYEWRPEKYSETDPKFEVKTISKYKLKLGISLMDIGHISYEAFEHKQYIVNKVDIDVNDFDNQDIQDAFDSLFASNNLDKNINVKLPTSINIDADWNINDKIYINMFTTLSMVSLNNRRSNNIVNQYILTPRFETKVFSAQFPLSYTGFGNFKAGFGFRLWSLYIGSGSILSNLLNSNSKTVDVYLGIKIPIFK